MGREKACPLARQVNEEKDEDSKHQILVDHFVNKATGTLRIRALDVAKFFKLASYGNELDHLTESLAYGYSCALREQGVAANAVTRFKEAVMFLKRVLHWSMDEEVTSSRRIAGVAHQRLKTLDGVKRAKALPPAFVAYLEENIIKIEDDHAKLELGCLLFLVYSRSKFGDVRRIQKEPDAQGEAKAKKTSGAKSRRGMALPVFAPKLGLAQDWGIAYMEARAKTGLIASLLLRFFSTLEGGRKSSVSLADCTAWLRKWLGKAVEKGVIPPVNTANILPTVVKEQFCIGFRRQGAVLVVGDCLAST